MKPIKSACSFVRRQLAIKGATSHNGRGAYDMEFDCEIEELEQRFLKLKSKLEKLGMLDENVRNYDGWEFFKIKPEFFDPSLLRNSWVEVGKKDVSYSTVGFNKAWASLKVFC